MHVAIKVGPDSKVFCYITLVGVCALHFSLKLIPVAVDGCPMETAPSDQLLVMMDVS
jgi:hypothetical protein